MVHVSNILKIVCNLRYQGILSGNFSKIFNIVLKLSTTLQYFKTKHSLISENVKINVLKSPKIFSISLLYFQEFFTNTFRKFGVH